METDKHFYELFEVNPQWIFELTGRKSPGPCRFISMTMKSIERSGKQEIENMILGKLPDLRDTQSGRDLIAIGIE